MAQIADILEFNVVKKITGLAKTALESCEQNREAILKLESLLTQAGFEDKELFKGDENFKIARKKILDYKGDSERELSELFKKFNITLK